MRMCISCKYVVKALSFATPRSTSNMHERMKRTRGRDALSACVTSWAEHMNGKGLSDYKS